MPNLKNLLSATLLALIIVSPASADDFAVQVYSTFAYQNYELEYLDSSTTGAPIALDLPTFELGSAITFRQWFIDANFSKSLRQLSETGSLSNNDSENKLERLTQRQSGGLSAGYVFRNGIVTFLGYKFSKTEFEETTTNINGNVRNVTGPHETTFTNSGPFMGAAYSFYITDSSILTVHSAYGRFSGEVTSEDINIDESNDLSASGVSFGAKAKLILAKKIDASVGADWREYEYAESGKGDLYRERVFNMVLQFSYVF